MPSPVQRLESFIFPPLEPSDKEFLARKSDTIDSRDESHLIIRRRFVGSAHRLNFNWKELRYSSYDNFNYMIVGGSVESRYSWDRPEKSTHATDLTTATKQTYCLNRGACYIFGNNELKREIQFTNSGLSHTTNIFAARRKEELIFKKIPEVDSYTATPRYTIATAIDINMRFIESLPYDTTFDDLHGKAHPIPQLVPHLMSSNFLLQEANGQIIRSLSESCPTSTSLRFVAAEKIFLWFGGSRVATSEYHPFVHYRRQSFQSGISNIARKL